MGRGVQTNRKSKTAKKAAIVDTDAKRQKWMNRKKQTRLWAILTETKDLAMLDAESIIDGDGDEVYRVIHSVGHDGMPSQDGWGGIRYFTTMFIHARFVSPVSDELQKKLDTWIATRREDVPREDANGFRSRVMEIEPCEVKVPGWERVSAKVLEKRKKNNIANFVSFMMNEMK